MAGGTVRGAVAQRDGDGQKPGPVAQLEEDIKRSMAWFESVAPKHIDPRQFVSLCLATVRRSDEYLQRAIIQNPATFLRAANECARLGLVPGDNYYFVAFKDSKTQTYQVTGIVGYKGEMDMIYRAGGVRSIHCHVVRANDQFRWIPGEMEIPHHVIAAPEGSGQVGLASDLERGHLTGVYAYCVLRDGGFSQPTVMGHGTVMGYRAFAKTDKFWGPKPTDDVPFPEIPSTPDMYRKTAIHKQFDMVPHSTEYLTEVMRVAAEIERNPHPVLGADRSELEAGSQVIAPVALDSAAATGSAPSGGDQ